MICSSKRLQWYVLMWREQAITFTCQNETLVGILHPSEISQPVGVLIVVGGPQYRVGSHRQFTLLARHLAKHDIPCLRFDYRSMGDSSGEARDFEAIDDDIRAAIDQFFSVQPTLQSVVIWGLCDAASAALFYAAHDTRVTGLVLLNPWVRTVQGEAQTLMKTYYRQRLFDRQFWRKLLTGRFDFGAALTSLLQNLRRALKPAQPEIAQGCARTLPERMLDGLQRFPGKVLFILSGNDLTAQEFVGLTSSDKAWQKAMQAERISRRTLPEANHTFSTEDWRGTVNEWTLEWVRKL